MSIWQKKCKLFFWNNSIIHHHHHKKSKWAKNLNVSYITYRKHVEEYLDLLGVGKIS